jgi:hypothetical protein
MTLIPSRNDSATFTCADQETNNGDQKLPIRDTVRTPGLIGP